MKIKKYIALIIVGLIFCHMGSILHSEVLPKPTYDNSVHFSFILNGLETPSSEIEYLKKQFGGGLYAPLTSTAFTGVSMDWHWDISKADIGIQGFKNYIDLLVQKAKDNGMNLHVILNYGDSRNVNLYKTAKTEDIRNAQWYTDNTMAEWNTMNNGEINEYVTTTFSRYARKLRKHLETGVKAVFKFLKKIQDENPDIQIIISAPGEVELNSARATITPVLQEFFCDYSPFAVLEFRDWIQHEGMYATGGKYEGEGYQSGGSLYQGDSGLQNFNRDFGTTFTTWDLKYYNWKLSDPVDTNYTDMADPDPNAIPFDEYTSDGMKPQTGPHYISNGFDPPRVMKKKGEDLYWDIFQDFRELMVYRYVKDMARIARESGFAKNRYYSHQIPGDYLWGTRPDDPNIILNERYYSSASPLWTANVFSDIGLGITMYDINYISYYGRTSRYVVPAVSSMSENWGVMEYNPEVTITDNINNINTVETIYQEIKRLYDYNAHMIGFYCWDGDIGVRFKGTNRELAAKQFFNAIKDKARQAVTTVFTPVSVKNFAGYYDKGANCIKLTWAPKIWSDLKHNWTDWGDFKDFVIYRGYTENFQCNTASEISRGTGTTYNDTNFFRNGMVYYKIAAENVNGTRGGLTSIKVSTPISGTPMLTVSRDKLHFGASIAGTVSSSQGFSIVNTGNAVLAWSVQKSSDWISLSSASGLNNGVVNVTVDASGKSSGTYIGTVTVSAGNAIGAPKTILIILTVYGTDQDSAPFGQIETPIDGSVTVSSVPVTGWALDDIGIESVKIYRKADSTTVYVGDATFVEGARPDVEAAYKTFPGSNKAGWGYMLLTNYFPNGGNGTFDLIAVARDSSGHETILGTKTIICDNTHAVKPFGAIDTPAQGAKVSGSSYVNFGWALTPTPNEIPTDGSTIDVYIDGVKVGRPVYNNFRLDISDAFPGYANSNGAVGYYIFDTTKYADGIHTISWVVKDNSGNEDGIGSRYFTIQNAAAQ